MDAFLLQLCSQRQGFSIFLHGKAGPIKGTDDKTEVLSVQVPDHLGGVIGHGQHIVQPELLTDADRRLHIVGLHGRHLDRHPVEYPGKGRQLQPELLALSRLFLSGVLLRLKKDIPDHGRRSQSRLGCPVLPAVPFPGTAGEHEAVSRLGLYDPFFPGSPGSL